MKTTMLILLIIFLPAFISAEDIEGDKAEENAGMAKKSLTVEAVLQISRDWQDIVKILESEESVEKKISALEAFIQKYPDERRYSNEAKLHLNLLKENPRKYNRIYSPYRDFVGLLGTSFTFSNVGLGAKINLFTFKWKYFYWEIINFSIFAKNALRANDGYPSLKIDRSLKFSSLIGIPLWLSRRNEIRIGTGPSFGWAMFNAPDSYGTISGYIDGFFNWGFEASWILHLTTHIALHLGGFAEIPVSYYSKIKDQYYRPIGGGFIGLRFWQF